MAALPSRPANAILLAVALLGAACEQVSLPPEIAARLPDHVDYGFHIRPLLADRCYACHGPDDDARQGDLHLYTEEGAVHTALPSGNRAIVPGSARKSEVFQRIYSEDPEQIMPPPESNLTLTDYDRALIAKWIDQGAEFKPHWSYSPPQKPTPPKVNNPSWVANAVDHFVLARLEREDIQPSEEERKERLLRRVTFDLTGLPPTVEEIDTFLSDTSRHAYDQLVTRLLASHAYGERMATEWLDVARYADSHGYHSDGIRTMWPWRDWVINAFNSNMPYDTFVTWQVAGDLIRNATVEQKLATGFNRNHPMTAEGGVIDEEYRVDYVADRANTTGRAILGITMECARCHDHKFDPVSQKDYYRFFAYFNSVKELGLSADDGNAGPLLMLMDEAEKEALAVAQDQVRRAELALAERTNEVIAAGSHHNFVPDPHHLERGLVDHYPFDVLGSGTTPNLAKGRDPAEVLGNLDIVSGQRDGAILFDSDYDYLHLTGAGGFDRPDPFSIAVWIRLDKGGNYARVVGNADNKHTYWRGWELYVDSLNRAAIRLNHARPHNYIEVRTNQPLQVGEWTHLTVTYDGSSRAAGVGLYLNSAAVSLTVMYDNLYKGFLPVDAHRQVTNRAPRVARAFRAFGGDDGILTGALDDMRIYDRTLSRAEAAFIVQGTTENALTDQDRLQAYLQLADGPFNSLSANVHHVREEEQAVARDVLEVMVMEDTDSLRTTHVLGRGLYDQPGEIVNPGVPASLGPQLDSLPRNRLGLAEWLFQPRHPLTARVAANRLWQMLFGNGIVSTTEDFGSQGALPTHPDLLDWLATTFEDSGWDVKALLRTIVTSSTYRQSSTGLDVNDPHNALLARGPRYRMPAEMIRDNALAASGLLVRKVGGPSVKPYQPPGLWIEKGNFSAALLNYKQDSDDGLYRRTLYTFIRRTSPPPSLTIFDAPDRNRCVVRRQNTNTPMQALVLLNDPQYVEAARMLAERMQREGGETLDERITHGFRLSTSRHPTVRELNLLKDLFAVEKERFSNEPADADSLLSVGEHARDPTLEAPTTAALAVVAGLMLNHDEAYTKR